MRTQQQKYWRKVLGTSKPCDGPRIAEPDQGRERPQQQTQERAGSWQPSAPSPEKSRERELLAELDALNQRIVAVESERDAAHARMQALESSLDAAPPAAHCTGQQVKSHQPALRIVLVAGFVLLLGALASPTPFLDQSKQSQAPGQPILLAKTETQADTLDGAAPAKTVSGGGQSHTARSARAELRTQRRQLRKPVDHRQWGPPLLLPDTQAASAQRRYTFDPLVKEQQQNLLALGFDLGQSSADGFKGPRTQQALNEFLSLYLSGTDAPLTLDESDLTFITGVYADVARRDAEKFNLDRGVVAAIRLSSVRTGVEFSYLMELAAAESAFNPVAQATSSSALGLYQFTQVTWLNTIRAHGEKYGLGDYAAQIEYSVDRRGNSWPRIRDAAVYQHVLDLRKNPRVSAMMAAESVQDHSLRLSSRFEAKPGRTELYLTHFLGPDGAISFLKELDENPDSFAVELFPTAAESNRSIFHPTTCKPRTVTEVYEVFSRKFHTSRYEDTGPY